MARILLTADDDVIGTGTQTAFAQVIGTNAAETVYVDNAAGKVTFDASFNKGGDTIHLTGDADSYTVVRSGSNIILTNAAGASVTIPAGAAGIEIVFDDGPLTLTADVAANQIKLGDQVVTTTEATVNAPDPVAQLEALEAAQANLDAETVDFSAAVVAAGLEPDVDADDDGIADTFDPVANDYVVLADAAVEDAIAALANDRSANGSDASLNQALAAAKSAVTSDTGKYLADGTADPAGTFTAAQLQNAANAATSAYAANVASKGDALTLAGKIEDAIVLYLANADNDDTPGNDLDDLRIAIDAFQALANPTAADVDDFYDAVEAAYAGVFVGGESILTDDGTRDDAVANLLVTLNTQAGLDNAADDAVDAFAATGHAADIQNAQDAIDARNEFKADVTTAQGHLAAVTDAAAEYAAAQQAVANATDALDFTINEIDNNVENGTADADLFTVNHTDLVALGDVTVNAFEEGDVLYLGSGLTFAADKDSGDNNVLEFFLDEQAGSAVLYIENTAFGSSNGGGDFTTITLAGVSADSLQIENGVVSFSSAAIA